MKFPVIYIFSLFVFSCNDDVKTMGTIERISPSLAAIIDTAAEIEVLSGGYDWTEGPLWLEKEKALLFSDIPPNRIYKWTEEKGAELYLTPSGYTGTVARVGEPGSNGLLLNAEGQLVLCQHGDRRMAIMDAPLDKPYSMFKTIADNYQGKRFNSPNDAVYRSNGDLFITDPPYGLEKNVEDTAKEIPFQGVYVIKPSGEVKLLTDTITRPNGIALMNNENTLLVANSDGDKAVWYLFDIDNDSLYNNRILYDATTEAKSEGGLPDGLKVDKAGNIFASGPGGVWIFDTEGKVAGKIKLPVACSNVALADDNKTLYITADSYMLRVKMRQ
ncbi:MAG: SMP-30/gluconolactonase/LRE family protein [Chitinophagaceae bacterium]|nr:SMP-30/gluconolactonase/LRE family protein [Chitinophagaceae bacterium]MCW5925505.1 SMP-30/gluconolactonase/LRE family protein [Chitinophagaceae bacterium]